jgi:hypothetical protein
MSEAASTDPSVSFVSLVVSLGSSALVHLGEIVEPGAEAPAKNLQLARDTIDVLQVLKDKTKGNLDDDETKLIDALLFDLRTKYMAATKG